MGSKPDEPTSDVYATVAQFNALFEDFKKAKETLTKSHQALKALVAVDKTDQLSKLSALETRIEAIEGDVAFQKTYAKSIEKDQGKSYLELNERLTNCERSTPIGGRNVQAEIREQSLLQDFEVALLHAYREYREKKKGKQPDNIWFHRKDASRNIRARLTNPSVIEILDSIPLKYTELLAQEQAEAEKVAKEERQKALEEMDAEVRKLMEANPNLSEDQAKLLVTHAERDTPPPSRKRHRTDTDVLDID